MTLPYFWLKISLCWFALLSSCAGISYDCLLERLAVLKKIGFSPQVIYDIGAHKGSWTRDVKKIFPHSQFFLFEANPHHKKSLKKLGYPYFLATLGAKEEETAFYMINGTGDSLFQELTPHYSANDKKIVNVVRLDSLVKQHNLPLPDLIKMDVQGAEKLIIEGGVNTVLAAEALILEVAILEYNQGAPLIQEIMTFLDNLGYRLIDILELHYLPTKELIQIDALFVKKHSTLIKTLNTQ